ncbi:DUF6371 domain-containing protein [Flavobacterium sp.]
MKYSFDTSSKKFICPLCNKKRFVRFIHIATNIYLDEKYGRCDRETSCGYFNKPETSVANPFLSIANPILKSSINNELPSLHSNNVLQSTLKMYCNNNFYLFLTTLFPKEDVQAVFSKYRIGTSKNWNGATVFWQIDHQSNIRAGKIILFCKDSCKRVKHPYPHITWVHSKLKIKDFSLKQCLFGLHLVVAKTKIAIVESEKTAIIMDLFMPEYIWIATGSKQNFKNEILFPIKNNEIIAFPDKSEYKDWQVKAIELNKIGYNISVSNYVENIDCNTGTDLADLYISSEKNIEVTELTNQQIEIIRLSEINPELLNLISTFELCDSFDNAIDVEKIKVNLVL